MLCKECRFFRISNSSYIGECQMKNSPVLTYSKCSLFPEKDMTKCDGCANRVADFGCFGNAAEDGQNCEHYEDKYEDQLREALYYWYKNGMYQRDKVLTIINDFEEVMAAWEEKK